MATTSSKPRVALVTGSSSGIGLSCVRRFVDRGVSVIVTGSRDKSLVADLLADLNRTARADYIQADLSTAAGVEALWAEVLRLYPDGVDILVNNAASTTTETLPAVTEFPEELWNSQLSVNLTAPFKLTKYSLPSMTKKGWGRIINMSSTMGVVSGVGSVVYSTFKHGLIGFTKGVALENAKHGVTCNAVCPGWTQTPMAERYVKKVANTKGITTAEAETFVKSKIATGKIIEPDQVAELVEFLCLSEASSQMTGASYLIDHGYTAQ